MVCAAGDIARAAALADDPLATELARFLEDDPARSIEHPIENNARSAAIEKPGQFGLALLDLLVAEIAAVKFEKVERDERHRFIAPAMT
jgi:hypothetical protein